MMMYCESCHEIGTHAIGCPDDESDAAIDRAERVHVTRGSTESADRRQQRSARKERAARRRKAQRRARVTTRGAAQ